MTEIMKDKNKKTERMTRITEIMTVMLNELK